MRGKIFSASEVRKICGRLGLNPEELGVAMRFSGAQVRAVEAGRRKAGWRFSEALRALCAERGCLVHGVAEPSVEKIESSGIKGTLPPDPCAEVGRRVDELALRLQAAEAAIQEWKGRAKRRG